LNLQVLKPRSGQQPAPQHELTPIVQAWPLPSGEWKSQHISRLVSVMQRRFAAPIAPHGRTKQHSPSTQANGWQQPSSPQHGRCGGQQTLVPGAGQITCGGSQQLRPIRQIPSQQT
jgi:hypothetical protein